MSRTQILVFAKAPQAGLAKTRLIPALGAEGAATLAHAMLHKTLAATLAAKIGPVSLIMTPGPADPAWQTSELPASVERIDQGEGDLGERMARAAQGFLARQQRVILIGTDCAEIMADTGATLLREAAEQLDVHDAVLYSTADGGYALLGLKIFAPSLFSHMRWSTASVAHDTRVRLHSLNWSVFNGPCLHDIDEAQDLPYLPGELARWIPSPTVIPTETSCN